MAPWPFGVRRSLLPRKPSINHAPIVGMRRPRIRGQADKTSVTARRVSGRKTPAGVTRGTCAPGASPVMDREAPPLFARYAANPDVAKRHLAVVQGRRPGYDLRPTTL